MWDRACDRQALAAYQRVIWWSRLQPRQEENFTWQPNARGVHTYMYIFIVLVALVDVNTLIYGEVPSQMFQIMLEDWGRTRSFSLNPRSKCCYWKLSKSVFWCVHRKMLMCLHAITHFVNFALMQSIAPQQLVHLNKIGQLSLKRDGCHSIPKGERAIFVCTQACSALARPPWAIFIVFFNHPQCVFF